MVERKTYFVTIDTEEIREESIPDSGIEYEIVATHEEVKEIEMLFAEKDKDAKDAMKYLKKPFDEWGADDKRGNYHNHLVTVYRRLFELGTLQTKNKIKELGLF